MSDLLQAINPYVDEVEQLASEIGHKQFLETEFHNAIEAALNGELSKTLRSLIPGEVLQQYGAFFTSDPMANRLVDSIECDFSVDKTIIDTTCGGGNLLLAYARRMLLKKSWQETLDHWGFYLRGFDIHEPFVRATRARLALLAAQRGIQEVGPKFINGYSPDIKHLFPNVQVENSLNIVWPQSDIYLLNPPFNIVPVPEDCNWASGRVSQAPLFISHCLRHALKGSYVRAILPDVLRSGSRYRRWRLEVGQDALWQGVNVLGKFDQETAVDVFLLKLQAGKPLHKFDKPWWVSDADELGSETTQKIGDLFCVSVGRLVPHRDKPDTGYLEYPYVSLREATSWETIKAGTATRRYNGKTFKPPFVLIRRTSRSKDRHRAVGTLVESAKGEHAEVAVENHLVVLSPLSGDRRDCELLMQILRDQRTSEWLNQRIRCRHLTVDAISSIPWWNL